MNLHVFIYITTWNSIRWKAFVVLNPSFSFLLPLDYYLVSGIQLNNCSFRYKVYWTFLENFASSVLQKGNKYKEINYFIFNREIQEQK